MRGSATRRPRVVSNWPDTMWWAWIPYVGWRCFESFADAHRAVASWWSDQDETTRARLRRPA